MVLYVKIFFYVSKLLKERVFSFLNIKFNFFWNIKKYYLGVEVFFIFFIVKVRSVIVSEIIEVKLGENELISYFDCGVEEGY